MTLHSTLWRLLVRVERHIPWRPPTLSHDDMLAASQTTSRGQRKWVMLSAVMPLLMISLINLARSRSDLAQGWPIWRSTILDVTVLLTGAVLVAAVAFGIHAWRRGPNA